MAVVGRVVSLLVAALAGAVFGVVGTVAQGSTMAGIPVGLILGIVGVAALMLAVRLLTDRWSALAAGVGLTVAVIVFSGEGPGGSVIAPSDSPFALVWTFACPLIAGVVVAWPHLESILDAAGRDRTSPPASPHS